MEMKIVKKDDESNLPETKKLKYSIRENTANSNQVK